MSISDNLQKQLLDYQRDEITEHHMYKRLAKAIEVPENKRILEEIANDELRHYREWRAYTQQGVKPDTLRVWKYCFISRVFGLIFGIKLMEGGEKNAREKCEQIRTTVEEADAILRDENEHKNALVQLPDEERLRCIGSIVPGRS